MIKGLKICGISDPKTLDYILNHPNPPKFLGFITNYEKSKRYIKYEDYSDISDIILFDSKGYHKSESFDHRLLDKVPDKINKMIAGNIQIDDIPGFKYKDFIIDLSGSLEDEKGKKDLNKIDKLLNLFSKI